MKNDHTKNLDSLRHSAAHLLAAAVLKLYPNAKPTIGPSIDDGFYYDFDFGDQKISPDDLNKIEKQMQKLVGSWTAFARQEITAAQAKKHYANNPYKQELIADIVADNQPLSLYHSGDFTDLCRGGHIDNPAKQLKHFKLLSIAGAYWRGDEKNAMLTRIYGTAFFTKQDLDQHLWQIEEAKKRDHRKLGKELELFTVSEDIGPGLAMWLPKGTVIKEELETWAKQTETTWGYQRVSTPTITKEGLYHTSGHLPYYQADMYPPMELDDGQKYYLKPMNCPHHHMIYKSRPRSYKELPLRLAEYGLCHRYEASGELFGLMRVRGLDMNDAHIYCTHDQAAEEFTTVMKLHEYYYKTLGIEHYHLEMALRDPAKKDKYHGDEAMWAQAEQLMRQAVSQVDIKMVEEEGSAAFYGPKIDFIVHSSIGREFAVSTNQIDLYMGDRFQLKYAAPDGSEQTPAIIHRAPLGSHERFIGFLIEHYAGAFPVWLSPIQAVIIPISEKQQGYADQISHTLREQGVRVENWHEAESMQKRIRKAEQQKIPYMLVVGDKEIASNQVAVRQRGQADLGTMALATFLTKITQEIADKSLHPVT